MTHLSYSIVAWIFAGVLSSAVIAQTAPTASSAMQSSSTQSTSTAAASGNANSPGAAELQRRLSMAHRRRMQAIEEANKQSDALMAANQETPETVAPRGHRAPTRHRSTRAAPAHSARVPDSPPADPTNPADPDATNGATPQDGSP